MVGLPYRLRGHRKFARGINLGLALSTSLGASSFYRCLYACRLIGASLFFSYIFCNAFT